MHPRLAIAIVSTLILSGIVLRGTAAYQQPREISGKFSCKGHDLDGRSYFGECTISRLGETYLLDWNVTIQGGGPSRYSGVGLLTDNVLSASWTGTGKAGVMAYKVEESGNLTGRWALHRTNTVATETLTRTFN